MNKHLIFIFFLVFFSIIVACSDSSSKSDDYYDLQNQIESLNNQIANLNSSNNTTSGSSSSSSSSSSTPQPTISGPSSVDIRWGQTKTLEYQITNYTEFSFTTGTNCVNDYPRESSSGNKGTVHVQAGPKQCEGNSFNTRVIARNGVKRAEITLKVNYLD